MVAAVLSILAALATGFYTMMLSQTRSATRYSDSVRADMMARAGIDYAIAQLRSQCFRKTEDPADPWYMYDYPRGAKKAISFPDSPLLYDGMDNDKDGVKDNLEEAKRDPTKLLAYSKALSNSVNTIDRDSDRFTLNVFDAQSRININACDNLGVLLDNLCRVIGPPLIAADQDAILPRRWAEEGAEAGLFDNPKNIDDKPENLSIYFWLYDKNNKLIWDGKSRLDINGRPKTNADGTAVFGDGYAIAGYRARWGKFKNLEDVKKALTYIERNANSIPDEPLEQLELEVKFATLRDYITIDSWIDTTTVCTGKFEWIGHPSNSTLLAVGIDRDKSWVPDEPALDPDNFRGSLRGCYLYIVNGHGAGQVRRIKTNGIDWIEVEQFDDTQTGAKSGLTIPPGPISSYMIVAPDDAKLEDLTGQAINYNYVNKPPPPGSLAFPRTDENGNFIDEPAIDYSVRPLCIHRAPINVNTASDKVLAAMFMGINVQQGHHLSVGTEADLSGTRAAWKIDDPAQLEPYLLTAKGLKRVPAVSGKIVLNTQLEPLHSSLKQYGYDNAFLDNYGSIGEPNFKILGASRKQINEAHELAYRVIIAREYDVQFPYLDPDTGHPRASNPAQGTEAYRRGPIKSWDDFYFRVIRPWDEKRMRDGWTDVNGNGFMDAWVDLNANQAVEPNEVDTYRIAARGRMIMAHFNSNTDILKFNPNIEWIDRWGRNFTEMEPVHIYPRSDHLPNDAMPIFIRYDKNNARTADPSEDNTFVAPGDLLGATHWSGKYNWCPAILADFDSHRAGAYVTRSFRYKTDEMIDKTDMNRSTSEFSFDSGGIFEITSIGQVVKRGQTLSERKLQALVKVYDVWRESTQRQFVQGVIECGRSLRECGPPGSSHSGQITRDAKNGTDGDVKRLPLVTLPEPLVPRKYRLTKVQIPGQSSLVPNIDVTDPSLSGSRTNKRNAYGEIENMEVPDVIANGVMPAGYDGQISLATNTQAFDPRGVGSVDSAAGLDGDSFLASFDGDLDTVTANGNGHEQSKVPSTPSGDGHKYRVVDTCSVLGLLNDTIMDFDPMGTNVPNSYMWGTGSTDSLLGDALRGLDPDHYWENAQMRTGDLRCDGVFLSSPGVGGNDSTLKYLIGDPDKLQTYEDDNWPDSEHNRANFDLMQSEPGGSRKKGSDGGEGFTLSMWAKPTWRHDDNRTHEFFNASNPGHYLSGRGFVFQKFGRYAYANFGDGGGFSGCARRKNDLLWGMEGEAWDILDRDNVVQLHGGANRVNYSEAPTHPESPGYRVQPFRWHFLGVRLNYFHEARLTTSSVQKGHWYRDGGKDENLRRLVNFVSRPFISTSTYPEDDYYDYNPTPTGQVWPYYMYLCNTLINGNVFSRVPDVGRSFNAAGQRTWWRQNSTGPWTSTTDNKGNSSLGGKPDVDCSKGADYGGRTAQDARWDWADPGTLEAPKKAMWKRGIPKVFSLNNLNYGETVKGGDNDAWMYRHMPEDGTYAVIDELKISKKERTMQDDRGVLRKDRIIGTGGGVGTKGGEMRQSRYYLPPNPSNLSECPTFTSQPMLQSLKGVNKPSTEEVTVARVTWTVFTPRFMHEYKENKTGRYKRKEYFFEGNYASGSPRSAGEQKAHTLNFFGPFDWMRYNTDVYNFDDARDPLTDVPLGKNRHFSVRRPAPGDYPTQAHATKGVQVELMNKEAPIQRAYQSYYGIDGKLKEEPALNGTTFTDPDRNNRIGNEAAPIRVKTSDLRYRVRFVYPIDPLTDEEGNVDPARHYLLDTPVLDDVSVTYFTKPRIIVFREIME